MVLSFLNCKMYVVQDEVEINLDYKVLRIISFLKYSLGYFLVLYGNKISYFSF